MRFKIITVCGLAGSLICGAVGLAQTNDPGRGRRQPPANSNSLVNTSVPPTNSMRSNANIYQANSSLPEARQPEAPDLACQYLTPADAEKILGGKVYLNGVFNSFVDKDYFCNYSIEGQNADRTKSAKLNIKTFATIEQARAANQWKLKMSELISLKFPKEGISTVKIVPEIGSDLDGGATLSRRGDEIEVICFQKDRTAFELSVSGGGGSGKIPTDVLIELAARITKDFNENQ